MFFIFFNISSGVNGTVNIQMAITFFRDVSGRASLSFCGPLMTKLIDKTEIKSAAEHHRSSPILRDWLTEHQPGLQSNLFNFHRAAALSTEQHRFSSPLCATLLNVSHPEEFD